MSRVGQARAKGWYNPATCTAQQMGDTHRQAARRVDHERVAGRHMVAGDLRPRNKVGACVEMHRSDGMNISVRSHESVGSVISCSKRMAKNAQSLPTRPSCRVSDSCNATLSHSRSRGLLEYGSGKDKRYAYCRLSAQPPPAHHDHPQQLATQIPLMHVRARTPAAGQVVDVTCERLIVGKSQRLPNPDRQWRHAVFRMTHNSDRSCELFLVLTDIHAWAHNPG